VDATSFLIVAIAAGVVALAIQYIYAAGFFESPGVRLPKDLRLTDVLSQPLPISAHRPIRALSDKLIKNGFSGLIGLWRAKGIRRFAHRVYLAPYVHEDESVLLLLTLVSSWRPRVEIMLHLITPLSDGRRVETSTLGVLRDIRPPTEVDYRSAADAVTVEELWSRHRRALTDYQRSERLPLQAEDWQTWVEASYASWLQAAIRAQRILLANTHTTSVYRIRERWEWD
jgi:hypothetical protein